MKKKIVILGSTGSIGSTTIQIIKNNSKDFDVVALSTNKNVKKLYEQVNQIKVKNSLKSLKGRHRDNRVAKRKGRMYIINKTNPRFKARQG